MDDNDAIHPKLAETLKGVPHSLQERLADALPGLLALAEALTPAAVGSDSGEVPLLEGMAEDGLLQPDAAHLEVSGTKSQPKLSDQVQDRTSTQSPGREGYRSKKRH